MLHGARRCVFCEIIARREPATIYYEDDEVIVFKNRLTWVPTMLLAVPKAHKTQFELWSEIGRVAEVAAEAGRRFCPNGFRILSNFGLDAMQSQPHAHLHVIGGQRLGPPA